MENEDMLKQQAPSEPIDKALKKRLNNLLKNVCKDISHYLHLRKKISKAFK